MMPAYDIETGVSLLASQPSQLSGFQVPWVLCVIKTVHGSLKTTPGVAL